MVSRGNNKRLEFSIATNIMSMRPSSIYNIVGLLKIRLFNVLLFVFAALKFRFALGVHGYEFLRNTNYPLPGYSTLTRRLHELEFNFGIFKELKIPLASKVEKLNRFCILNIDVHLISMTVEV